MCQHVSTNLQQQNSLIQVLTKSFESQQELIQKQGHQINLLSDKLERLTNIAMDNFQEALEDIKEPEYEEDGYRAEQYPQHTSPGTWRTAAMQMSLRKSYCRKRW